MHQPEAGIDILGEDAQEIVDDTGAVHGRYPCWKKRRRFSSHAAITGFVALRGRAGITAMRQLLQHFIDRRMRRDGRYPGWMRSHAMNVQARQDQGGSQQTTRGEPQPSR